MATQTIEDVLGRGLATRNAQEQVLTTWTWDEMSLDDWDDLLGNVRDARQAAAVLDADQKARRGELDGVLDDLEARTQQGVGMIKIRLRRDDPGKLTVINALEEKGSSREAILEEAGDWEAAWEEVDAAWNPTTGNTLAAFKSLRAQSLVALQAYTQARTAWRAAAGRLNEQIDILDDRNVAWYGAATRVFRPGTPEGDMIRGTIPTYDNAAATPAPTPNPAPTPTPPQP